MKNIIFASFILVSACFASFAQTNIRKVDFKNFTYDVNCIGEDSRKITVKNGEYIKETKADDYTDRFYFTVYGFSYGDIDGDGQDEAAMISMCNTGGTGNFTAGHIYKMKEGKPVLIGEIPGGDRAYGGLREIKIENGLLIVKQNDVGERGGACCPEFEVTTKMRYENGKFSEIGKSERRELYPAQTVTFAKGTSKTSIKVRVDEISRFSVGARAGQTMKVSVGGEYMSAELIEGDAEVKADANQSFTAELRQNGNYKIQLQNLDKKPQNVVLTIEIN